MQSMPFPLAVRFISRFVFCLRFSGEHHIFNEKNESATGNSDTNSAAAASQNYPYF